CLAISCACLPTKGWRPQSHLVVTTLLLVSFYSCNQIARGISMANRWVMNIEQHPIHATLGHLQDRISSIEGAMPSDADVIEGVDRLKQILSKLTASLEASDPNITPKLTLDQVNSLAQNIVTHLSNYQSNSNKQHIIT